MLISIIGYSGKKSTGDSDIFFNDNSVMKHSGFSERLNRIWKECSDAPTNQTQLAKWLGFAQPTVNDWINGKGMPGIENAIKIAEKFNVCVEWFITGKGLKRATDKQQSSPLLEKFNQLGPDQQQIIELMVDQLSNKPKSSENKENKPLTPRPENVGGGVNLPDPLASYRRRQGDELADKEFIEAVQHDYEKSK
jgi:DNA-binding XRE family transcriptional regulator